ncbi:MAG: MarR family transcriptional regulator [Candidatus Binatia bacterium]
MDAPHASQKLLELFVRVVNRYNALEKLPVQHRATPTLYHSERHLLDHIGNHPEQNVTELATAVGVTKGAISQVLKKLETKGLVRRYKRSNNDKEVFVALTTAGCHFYDQHQAINAETVDALRQELARHSADKVDFLLSMFQWFDAYLARSRERMRHQIHHQK